MEIIYNINSIEDTKKIATILSKYINNIVVLLSGDIGAGKTTFTSFLINELSLKKQVVTSPTFPIVQYYETKIGLVYHLDLYRINDEKELFNLGIDEILMDSCIIEWPEKLGSYSPKHFIKIDIVKNTEEARTMLISFSSKYKDMYNKIKQEIGKV